jgi:glycosyltransferase involved in cell wall biosynthesis
MFTIVDLYGSYPLDLQSVWAVARLNAHLTMLLAEAHPDWEVLAVSPGAVPIPGVGTEDVQLPVDRARRVRRLGNPLGGRVLGRAVPRPYRNDPQRWLWADQAAARLAARGLDRPTTTVICTHAQPLLAARRHLPRARIVHWLHTSVPRQYLDATLAADVSVVPSIALYRAAWSKLGGQYPSPIWVIPNWVDHETFRPPSVDERRDAREGLGLDDDVYALAFVGRQWFKGGRVLEEALKRLPRATPPVVLLSAGEPQVGRVILGPGREIRRLGRIAPRDLRTIFAAADLGVMPSVIEESFGMAAVEMMACGLPVVASRTGAIPEILSDGITGRLVDLPNSVECWVDAIGELLADDEARSGMGAAAHRTVLERYLPSGALHAWSSMLTGPS